MTRVDACMSRFWAACISTSPPALLTRSSPSLSAPLEIRLISPPADCKVMPSATDRTLPASSTARNSGAPWTCTWANRFKSPVRTRTVAAALWLGLPAVKPPRDSCSAVSSAPNDGLPVGVRPMAPTRLNVPCTWPMAIARLASNEISPPALTATVSTPISSSLWRLPN